MKIIKEIVIEELNKLDVKSFVISFSVENDITYHEDTLYDDYNTYVGEVIYKDGTHEGEFRDDELINKIIRLLDKNINIGETLADIEQPFGKFTINVFFGKLEVEMYYNGIERKEELDREDLELTEEELMTYNKYIAGIYAEDSGYPYYTYKKTKDFEVISEKEMGILNKLLATVCTNITKLESKIIKACDIDDVLYSSTTIDVARDEKSLDIEVTLLFEKPQFWEDKEEEFTIFLEKTEED